MAYATRLLPAAGTYAELDLVGPATQLDTVIQAVAEGPDGNLITIAAVADSGLGDGVTFVVTGTDIVCHFEDGVSTVQDFEDALAADAAVSALIQVKTAGTAAAVLAVADDDFAATPLAGGGATSNAAPTYDDEDAGVAIIPCDALQIMVRSVAGSGSMTATVTLWGFHEELGEWFKVKALNAASAIAETGTDLIRYAEWIGLGRYSRLHAQLSVAGTGTEVAVYVDRLRRLTAR